MLLTVIKYQIMLQLKQVKLCVFMLLLGCMQYIVHMADIAEIGIGQTLVLEE